MQMYNYENKMTFVLIMWLFALLITGQGSGFIHFFLFTISKHLVVCEAMGG